MRFTETLVRVGALSATCVSGSVLPLHRRDGKQSNPAPLTGTKYGSVFDVEVQFGDQPFMLLVDTGSSDTWVVETGYTCIDSSDNSALPQSACGYAASYNRTSTFTPIEDQTFGVKYGAGIAMGTVGTEDLTMAGKTVTGQTVGIVNSTDDADGDGIQSGILGLSYPSLTSAHPGTNYPNASEALITNRTVYDPFFHSMFKRGLVEPWFSVTLDRLPENNASTGPGGYLGLGELPPVAHADDWAVVPVEITEAIPDDYYANGEPELTYWSLTVDAVTWGPANASTSSTTLPTSNTTTNSTSFQAAVDTGNNLNFFPVEVAQSINGAFDPPATEDESSGIFSVDCSARAPSLGVVIGGRSFWTDARDIIVPLGDGTCISGVGATYEALGVTLHFLGVTFLKGVVSVFDLGEEQMKFAARTDGGADTGNCSGETGGESACGYGDGNGGYSDSTATSGASYNAGGYLVLAGLTGLFAL